MRLTLACLKSRCTLRCPELEGREHTRPAKLVPALNECTTFSAPVGQSRMPMLSKIAAAAGNMEFMLGAV